MNTGIYIRALIDDKWQSVDIGDPRLSAEEFLRWFVTYTPNGQRKVMDAVVDAINTEAYNEEEKAKQG